MIFGVFACWGLCKDLPVTSGGINFRNALRADTGGIDGRSDSNLLPCSFQVAFEPLELDLKPPRPLASGPRG